MILQINGCDELQNKSLIRGNYNNVLQFPAGAIISTRRKNSFIGGFDNGVMFRDSIYYVNWGFGYMQCSLGESYEVQLIQSFELNTFAFWLWDISVTRTYSIKVYVEYQDIETIIFDQQASKGVVRVNFKAQLVQSFRIYNSGGNSENTDLHIIKVEAYYKF